MKNRIRIGQLEIKNERKTNDDQEFNACGIAVPGVHPLQEDRVQNKKRHKKQQQVRDYFPDLFRLDHLSEHHADKGQFHNTEYMVQKHVIDIPVGQVITDTKDDDGE